MVRFSTLAALALLLSLPAGLNAQPGRNVSRGEMLYTTHCIACHTDEMHWRDRKSVTDWKSLVAQVRRWQGNAALGWTDEDIGEVVRYLNSVYYRLPNPA